MTVKCPFQLIALPLGKWNTNCYVLIRGGESIIVDPAAEPERILAAVEGTAVQAILLTHGHLDHVQALDAVRQASGAPLGLHPADATEFGIVGDFNLNDGNVLTLSGGQLTVVTPPVTRRGASASALGGAPWSATRCSPAGRVIPGRPRPCPRFSPACRTRSLPGPTAPPFTPVTARGAPSAPSVRPSKRSWPVRARRSFAAMWSGLNCAWIEKDKITL